MARTAQRGRKDAPSGPHSPGREEGGQFAGARETTWGGRRSFDAEIGKRAFSNRRRAEGRQALMIGPTATLIEKPAEATRQSLFDVGTASTSAMAGLSRFS